MGRHLFIACLLSACLTACGSRTATLDPDSAWPDVDILVQGVVDTTFTDGLAHVDHAASTTGESGRRVTLLLRPRRHPDPVVVLKDLPLDLGPGQYTLSTADSTRRPSAYYAYVDATREVVYGQDVRGMLAITDTSGGWDGRFRFGVRRGHPDSTAAPTRPDTARTVAERPDIVVEGTFRRVPRLRAGSVVGAGAAEPPTD
jgi:hypothetical protein